MKIFKILAIAVLGALTIASCNKQDPDAITIATSTISFSSEGGIQAIAFTTNVAWKAVASNDWITVTPDAGEAGEGAIIVTVAPNANYEDRTGTVTVTAGSKTTVFAVCQTYAQVFEVGNDIELTSDAQEFVISTKTNVNLAVEISGGEGWLTEVSTKAVPVEASRKFAVTENLSVKPREAVVKISSANESFTVSVLQGANPNAASIASVKYLGNKQRIYDAETYEISKFCQWAVELENAEAKTFVTVVLNGVKANVKTLAVPAGEYEVDAAGTHAVKTFSIASADGVEKVYTAIVKNGKEITVADGIVTVAEDGSITATLLDEADNTYSFFTVGSVPAPADNSLGAQLQTVTYKANYNTYFANNNNEWNLSLYVSNPISTSVPFLYNISLNIFGNADGELSPGAFPTGTYTFKEPSTQDSGYATGNTIADPFSISAGSGYISKGYDETGTLIYHYADLLSGSVVITKEGDEYSFDLNLKLKEWHYDASWSVVEDGNFDYNYKFTEVSVISVTDNGVRPVPDGDIVLTTWGMTGGYSGMWFGNSYALMTDGTTANSVFILGDTTIEGGKYYFQAVLNTSKAYTYVKNYASRFCNTLIPAGEYSFTAVKPTEAGDFLAKNTKTYQQYRSIKNSYTGTYFYYDGGSITITDKNVTFNLTASSLGDAAHSITAKSITITGTLTNSCMYFQDYSGASRQKIVAWYTE